MSKTGVPLHVATCISGVVVRRHGSVHSKDLSRNAEEPCGRSSNGYFLVSSESQPLRTNPMAPYVLRFRKFSTIIINNLDNVKHQFGDGRDPVRLR
jgi:hypothetical protein